MAANNSSTGKQSAGGGAIARELEQLKKKVKELTLRLENEVKARKLDTRLAAEAKKVREQLTKETNILRAQGQKLASQLKSTLSDASKREQALKGARDKVAELKNELGVKTADLKRKSVELKRLAAESAHRATTIMRGKPKPAVSPAATSASPAVPTESASGNPPSDKPTPT